MVCLHRSLKFDPTKSPLKPQNQKLTMSLCNDIIRFSVLGLRSDIRIELQAPVVHLFLPCMHVRLCMIVDKCKNTIFNSLSFKPLFIMPGVGQEAVASISYGPLCEKS